MSKDKDEVLEVNLPPIITTSGDMASSRGLIALGGAIGCVVGALVGGPVGAPIGAAVGGIYGGLSDGAYESLMYNISKTRALFRHRKDRISYKEALSSITSSIPSPNQKFMSKFLYYANFATGQVTLPLLSACVYYTSVAALSVKDIVGNLFHKSAKVKTLNETDKVLGAEVVLSKAIAKDSPTVKQSKTTETEVAIISEPKADVGIHHKKHSKKDIDAKHEHDTRKHKVKNHGAHHNIIKNHKKFKSKAEQIISKKETQKQENQINQVQ